MGSVEFGATPAMKLTLRIFSAIAVIAALAMFSLTLWKPGAIRQVEQRPIADAAKRGSGAPGASMPYADEAGIPLFGHGFIDESGYSVAYGYTAPIDDRASLEQVYAASFGRSKRGKAHLEATLARLNGSRLSPDQLSRERATARMLIGLLAMYDADFAEADRAFAQAVSENPNLPRQMRDNIAVMRGVAALRRGEVENCVACVGPSSCIYPIDPAAVHLKQDGSRKAIEHFEHYLQLHPEDLGVRWLLNLSHMTLGTYPGGVSPDQRIGLERFKSKLDIGRFTNVSSLVGLDSRGPNMSGGNVFDDFDGDGLADLFVISTDWTIPASLFINMGDGRFEDRGHSWGLDGQKMALNLTHADYDNDGRLDVLILRGGWETPYRLSLLRNTAKGTFEDVTVAAGLDRPIATQTAAWGDYDNDGKLDIFVGGEFQSNPYEPRNRCRLYHNNGDGTFTDVAAKAGVENDRWAKGAVFGDYDDDGLADIYVSNMNDANRLYRNNGDGTFTDVAPELGLVDPLRSFACWFWDYDNDGKLDLFVTGFGAWVDDVVADMIGAPTEADRPRLYHNLGGGKFADVTRESGLSRVWLPMGSNFADIDNDGFLDVYLGTGRPPYSHVVPNIMLKNVDGKTFEDVTESSGTGHLQKGHGVSFADWDNDGDLDLFVQAGGTTPGDVAHNILFQNPGHGRHWLKIKLVGVKTNRSAIGARIQVDFDDPKLGPRTIYRHVNGGSSFGGNSLTASIGLGEATRVKAISILWPVGRRIQTFRNLEVDRTIVVTEGSETLKTLQFKPLPQPKATDDAKTKPVTDQPSHR